MQLQAQILRHRSFTFQEFSQRYADAKLLETIELPELRRQDSKNRQNSIDDLDPAVVEKLEKQMNTLFSSAFSLYNQMLDSGVAKECARMVLPLCTPTENLYDRFLSFVDTLYKFTFSTRNTKRTYGYC